MKYTDLSINLGFHRNMRETNWLKLFPHWWSENDPLLQSIGAEVERIKAQAIFDLLNVGLKPPVLLWQTSINHEKFNTVEEITELPHYIEIEAPLYKTWGKITIKNQSNTELYDLKIMITENDGVIIHDAFAPEDVLVIDITEQIFHINNRKIKPQIIGNGFPYFKTVQNVEITKKLEEKWDPKIPLHNEIVRIFFETDTVYNSMNLKVDVEMHNVVFINEQNIEITSLELIPLDRVELYVYYDFPFNEGASGWKKIGAKTYEPNTRVIYDMITIQHYTRKFYAKVWFKGLDYPYKVGFPCWRDEDEDSIYHVNPRLDVWGEYLGLPRRMYKDNILEEDYYKTFPRFYEFDIEQDFWYYSRLVNEYAWNDLAIDEVDVLDTNEDPILRLHSIDPFVQDFAIHARSHYPEEVEGVNYLTFIPSEVTQNSSKAKYKQTDFENVFNLLKDDDYPTYTILHNKADYAINNETYKSKELDMFFDLSSLPENVNIDGFEIIIDAEATDNNASKYNDERTRIQIIDNKTCLYEQNIEESDVYELERKNIIYGASDRLFGMETVASNIKKVVNQHATIEENFQGTLGTEVRIPFEIIEDIKIEDIKIKYPSGMICNGTYQDGIIKTVLPNTHEIDKEYYFANIYLIVDKKSEKIVGLEVKNAILDGKYKVTLYHQNTNTDDENNDVKTVYIQNNKTTVSFDSIENDISAITIENDEYCILYLLDEDNVIQNSYKFNKKDSLEVIVSSEMGSSNFLVPYKIFPRTHRYTSYSIGISPTNEQILYNRTDYNLRDILQKNGVHFIFALENEDEINTPTIYIYNAYFRVYFSPKKTNFKLETRIDKGTDQFTDVGKLFVKITNIGDKPLQTICNMLPENNIKLSKNAIDVDLEVGEFQETQIDIEHQLPIIDGEYEIITICENQKRMNYVNVRSNGLIETSIDVPAYSTHYHKNIELITEIKSIDNSVVNQGIMSYYVKGIKIGETEVHNGKAVLDFKPSDYNIKGGMYTLEVRYADYQYDNNYIPKYASSRSINDILISNQPTYIEILSDDYGFAKGNYTLKAKVTTYSDDFDINEGTISFYLDDELVHNDDNKLGSYKVINNKVEVDQVFKNKKAGIYTLKAVYDGTNQFGRSESTKEIILYGGATETLISDIYAYPGETITLKAHVQQIINSAISGAYSLPVVPENYYALYSKPNGETPNANKITFYINNEKINGKVDFNSSGNAILKYDIPLNILGDLDEKTYTIKAYYEGLIVYQTEEDYRQGKKTTYFEESYGEAKLIVAKKDTEIVCADVFSGSNYETLGFYIKVQEFGTNIPVKEGKVKLSIPGIQKINKYLQPQEVEQDGGVRFIIHPVDFFDREWSALEKTTFNIDNIRRISSEERLEYEEIGHLFRIYDGKSELDLLRNDFTMRNFHLMYYIRKEETGDIEVSKDIKQVYIYNDHLYAQTDSDEIINDISYTTDDTKVPIQVDYIPTPRYKKSNKDSQLKITFPYKDVDLHAYDFDYTDEDPIRAWVSNYDWDADDTTEYDGKVYFYLDDTYLGKSLVANNLATIPHDALTDVSANTHLLCAEYIPKGKNMAHTYAYNILNMRKADSSINAGFDYILKDYDSILHIQVILNTQSLNYGYLYGNLNIYLNDKLYDKKVLRGTLDNGEYDCNFHIPSDIDEKDYIVRIEYEGNDYVNPSSWQQKLQHQKLPVDIFTKDVYGVSNSTVYADISLSAANKYDINEGMVALYKDNTIVSSAKVYHNRAKVKIDIGDVNTDQEYQVKYIDGINYKNNDDEVFIQKVIILTALEESYVSSKYDDTVNKSNGTVKRPFTNLLEAYNCTKTNGIINIIDDCILKESININRDINIKGYNNSKIIKDLPDLFLNENYGTSLKIHNLGDFDKELFEVTDLKLSNLNTEEFRIIKNELYYIKNNELIHIYLLNDGKFYSFTPLSGLNVNEIVYLNIKSDVTFDNVEFISKDNDNDFVITNEGSLKITHSIINKNMIINTINNPITINYSLVYGDVRGTGDLSFNWWGYNDAPYNDNIILRMKTDIYPPVIGEDFYVEAELVGKNGKRYNIPPVWYEFTSDCEGYFQNEIGYMVDQEIKTLYTDAIKQGKVNIKVDNQTLSLPVYDYDYKTEVILDDATEIPINYQVPLRAKVQSCADTYYKFDEYNNIIQSSNTINEGNITFYLDDVQIGKGPVVNGQAEILVFFDNTKYETNKQYNFVAKYNDESKTHFKSENNKIITLFSEENTCFVSTDGNNYNDGTFKNPVQTIQQALSLNNVNKIYIKEGVYSDNNIIIDKNVSIKKYNGDVSFTYDDANSILINISDGKNVELSGLNFLNNNCTYIINNLGNLTVRQCVFNKNICQNDINTNSTAKNYIYDSVLLDPNIINNGRYITKMQYCWFGTNTPDGLINNYSIDDYIIMDFESSKENIYIGTVAHLKSSLLKYMHNKKEYSYEGSLPLRIAMFESDSGSLMPLKDYTHSNYAISLFNTNEDSNSKQIFIEYKDVENYIDYPIHLECSVNYSNGKEIDEGKVVFNIYNKKEFYTYYADVHNSIAKITIDDLALQKGEYPINCSYTKDGQKYMTEGTLRINHLSIIIEDLDVTNIDLNHLNIYSNNIVDSLGNTIQDQKVSIYIDNVIAYNQHGAMNFNIKNGTINDKILYPMQTAGYHTLKITTNDIYSEYEELNYKKVIKFVKKETDIDFPYSKIQEGYQSDLMFNVYDNDHNIVIFGTVDVYLNNQIMYENVSVKNGQVTLKNFVINNKGKYSILIHYHGDANHYEDTLYINNNVNVGLYEVIIDEEDIKRQLKINIVDNLNISFNIYNVIHDKIHQGHVKLYIDDIPLNEGEYIGFEDELISYKGPVPQGMTPGKHIFTIAYEDTKNEYIDTNFDIPFNVSKIQTDIVVGTITTTPNKTINVDYDIATSIGSALTGTLVAYLDDAIVGQIDVTTDIQHKIPINIPLINENKVINFEYYDNTGYYEDSKASTSLIINRDFVKIEASYSWYYPNKDFDFTITVKDQEGKIVNDGDITLYIDSIKETTSQSLVNGQTNFILNLNQIKKYTIRILFSNNDYYANTTQTQILDIKKIPIYDITFENPLVSEPNSKFNNILIFDVFEDYNISDGIVDFYLNNQKIHTYYMTTTNKNIRLDIPNLDSGTYYLKLQYYDSDLFSNFEKTYEFEVSSMDVEMHMNDINARLNDTINIDCQITPAVKGLVKYYIGVNTENLQFIGLKQANEIYDYTLTKDTLQESDQYIIVAHFDGNNQYREKETQCTLNIQKEDGSLNVYTNNEVIYNSTLNIQGSTNIQGNPAIDLYISSSPGDKIYINTVFAKNKSFQYEYKLPPHIVAGNYAIIAEYQGSPIINPTSSTKSFKVIKDTPKLKQTSISLHKGNFVELENILYDINNINLKSGMLEYKYNGEKVYTAYELNNKYLLDLDPDWSQNTDTLTVTYKPTSINQNKYNEKTYTIDLTYLKNDIEITIDTEEPPLRGESFNVNVHAKSYSTLLPVDVSANYYISRKTNFSIKNGYGNINPSIPNTFTSDECKITINTEENDIFKESSIDIDIPISYLKTVYVDKNANTLATGEENDPVKTIEIAYNLLNRKGTIILLTDLNKNTDTITIEKDITIDGRNNTLSNFNFENKNRFIITNTDFNSSTIINDGVLNINNCNLTNDSNITTNNEFIVKNSIFENNSTDDDGACISIGVHNQYTLIEGCTFNENSAQGKGGCIESNQGNDLIIQNCTFTNNSSQYLGGSCISINGKANINHNLFMKNSGTSDILLLTGFIESEVNIFDGEIMPIKNNNGEVIANMTYWGQNDKNIAINKINSSVYTNKITADTWLLSDYKKESILRNGQKVNKIYPLINKYANEDEYGIEYISDAMPSLIIEYNNNEYKINEDYIEATESIDFKIGQETIEVNYD